MAYLLVRHRVKDFAKWKPIFDEHSGTRKTSGSKSSHVFRNSNDPNEIVLLFEWDDIQKARQFAESEDLRRTMEREGVSGKPDVYFLEEIERTSS